jgi:hypothetical protein
LSALTVQQQARQLVYSRAPYGPYPWSRPLFPKLDTSPAPLTGFGWHPAAWQVLDEGARAWYRDEVEYTREYYRACGPIAVAHAVNFTRAAMSGRDSFETWNIADSIDVCVNVGAYTRGDQTSNTYALRQAIEFGTGIDCDYSWGGLSYERVIELAKTRWVVVNTPGHISLVIFDTDAGDLRLVQYKITAGPRAGWYDANDLHIDAGEWASWNRYTCWPVEELWTDPTEPGLVAQFFAERKGADS